MESGSSDPTDCSFKISAHARKGKEVPSLVGRGQESNSCRNAPNNPADDAHPYLGQGCEGSLLQRCIESHSALVERGPGHTAQSVGALHPHQHLLSYRRQAAATELRARSADIFHKDGLRPIEGDSGSHDHHPLPSHGTAAVPKIITLTKT